MKLRREAVLLCALAVCVLAVSRASAQQVRCFRSLPCGGTDFFMADSVAECCLHDDGLLVELTPGSEACEICRVFGWISGDPVPDNNNRKTISFPETGERQPLVVGFSKGIPTTNYDILLRGTVTEGTAEQGATADFRLEGDFGRIEVSFARAGNTEMGGPNTTVPAIIQIDNVALEENEDFILSFEVTSTSPDNLLTGGAVVLVTEVQVFIEDQTDFTVQFTEFDYSQDENRFSLPVAVLITTAIASDLELRIVKQNLSQVYTPLPNGGVQNPPIVTLPDGFAMLGPFNPAVPYIASSVDGAIARIDYDASTQNITFTAGPARTIQTPVAVFDDLIDEADEEYFVLFLQTDNPRVDLTNGRFASRGIIRDNEITRIGFEMDSYTFLESTLGIINDVRVIREDNQQSELTFSLRILYTSQTAVQGDDFFSQPGFDEEFEPDEENIVVPFLILDDELFEGRESFLLDTSNIGNVPFSAGRFPSATVFIEDDEDVQIGFEETEFTVPENVGQVELCLVVTAPAADVNFTGIYRIGAETVEGTATSADYEEITRFTSPRLFFTNENRRHCFNVIITDDMLFEESETFTVEARENPPFFTDIDGVSLHPNRSIVTITITDMDTVEIGYVRTSISVGEDVGSVDVNATVLSGSLGTSVGIRSATADGTAVSGEDYETTSRDETFSTTVKSLLITVPIINDTMPEGPESFDACLTFLDESDLIARGLRDRITLNPDKAEIMIVDDDDQPVVFSFEFDSYNYVESAGMVNITVDKAGTHMNPITVRVFGGPSSQTDIVQSAPAIDTTLTFNSGDTRLPAFLDLTDDFVALEAVESYIMELALVVVTPGVSIVPPGTATLNVRDDDEVTVRFVERMYRVQEDMGPVEVCLTRDIASLADVIVTITTVDGTATSPADYSPLVSHTVNLGTAANNIACVNIDIVADSVMESDESFTVVIDRPTSPGIRVGVPDTASVLIEEPISDQTVVNDTVDADPILTVPLHVLNLDDVHLEGIQLSMCFELHGHPDDYFNLVSDECLSANAYYDEVDNTSLHIITRVAIRAADNAGSCHNITVFRDPCSISVNGVMMSAFSSNGIDIKVYSNRIRVSVPNCDEMTVVLYLYCRSNTFWADEDTPVDADFLYMRVMRGLNFGHRNSHGLIGQFWNVDATIANYTGPLKPDVMDGIPRYSITLQRPESGEMATFTGDLGQLQWDGTKEPCLFVGDAQAGPVYEVDDNNDAVIEGKYQDYVVSQPFNEDGYRFGRFAEDQCQ